MPKQQITIIIVTYNSEKYIVDCLLSILESNTKNISVEIIVIDNNSSDLTVSRVKELRKSRSGLTLIQNTNNYGFAHATNQGILRRKKTDYCLLLNPDTIVNNNSIRDLVRCATKNKAGIVGGNTYDRFGIQNGSYFRFPNIFIAIFDFTNLRKLSRSGYWHNYFYYKDVEQSKENCFPVEVVTGGFMLVSSNAIQKIGLFDERFFMYLEDVDYCIRASHAGITVFHTNLSKIVHFAGRSSNNKDRIRHSSWLRSRKFYFLKNFNLLENLIIQPIFLLDDLFILFRLITNR